MNIFTNYYKMTNRETLAFLIVSTLLTVFLFYIDEGLYNFEWMSNIGAWFVFLIYTIVFFVGQLLVFGLLFKISKRSQLLWISITSGIFLGGIALFLMVF